ncbi:D-alanyl-D-alanine carboxypeptidase [Bacillus licheniformis]|nr:D-alanyl-D-alanine carboxypeptidase [Bacillus licheniformis]
MVGDDSWYDEIRYSQDLSWTDEDAYYGAQISALTVSPNEDYDAGTVIIDVNPAGKPEKPAVLLTPQTNHVKSKRCQDCCCRRKKISRLKETRRKYHPNQRDDSTRRFKGQTMGCGLGAVRICTRFI